MKFLKCATFTDTLTEVDVESTLLRGLPGFKVVGLAGITIKESEERVKSSLNALNFKFPAQKIIINLSPSDTPKNGSHWTGQDIFYKGPGLAGWFPLLGQEDANRLFGQTFA